MIYQAHDRHGKHIAYNVVEAEANKKNGWKTVTKEEFYAKKLPPQSIPAVETSPVAEAGQETQAEAVAVHKRRGRPTKVTQ